MHVQLFGADGCNKREKTRVVSGNVLPIAKARTLNDLPDTRQQEPQTFHFGTMSGCSHSRPGIHLVHDHRATMLYFKNNFPTTTLRLLDVKKEKTTTHANSKLKADTACTIKPRSLKTSVQSQKGRVKENKYKPNFSI